MGIRKLILPTEAQAQWLPTKAVQEATVKIHEPGWGYFSDVNEEEKKFVDCYFVAMWVNAGDNQPLLTIAYGYAETKEDAEHLQATLADMVQLRLGY